ncbi:hypothetical protein SAMN04487897_11549 [Paenibacillus sp. yr247]|uniref:hypothetical protein n=1 Tax=Paenibacillus sp. yr247 TaxID=1761880 RepID=UPI00088B79D9|nr:hypothetical protein [Paenibacillus sp. yr247]SDO48933.1 hypothetical protein SAMN04487897_11549 [Paenibacillus sp. yr247]
MKNRMVSISLVTGITLLTLIVAAFMVPSLLFLAGVPMLKADFWLAAALAVLLSWIASKKLVEQLQVKVFAISVGLSALLFICGFILCGYFYDLSYDGQAYHQEAIIHLAEGWNPIYDKEISQPTGNSMWINHYAKAAEIAAASIYKATGLLEQSKVINLLVMAASFLISLAALLTLRPKNRVTAWVVALLLALNPVSIYQSFTFYVDGLLGSLLLCLIALGCLVYTRSGWLLLSMYTLTMIMMMNIKFTAIGYAGVLTIGLLIVLYMSEQFTRLKQLFRLAALGGMIGVLIVGYNPYVTNTLHDGHPFYPLAGENAIDVVKNFTPRNLERMNRFEQVAASYFAEPMGNSTDKKPTQFQWPFIISAKELPAFAETDVAVAGFGPLFSGALVLALIVLVLSFRRCPGITLAAIGVIAVLAGSSFINPAAWWARYVPQLWAVPLICVFLALCLKEYRLLNGVGIALAFVLATNTLLVSGSFTTKQWAMSEELRGQLAQLKSVSQPVKAEFTYSWSNRERLKAYGIEFKEETPLSCSSEKVTLIKSGTTLCIDNQDMQANAQ